MIHTNSCIQLIEIKQYHSKKPENDFINVGSLFP